MNNILEGFLDTVKIMTSLDIREDMIVSDFGCGSGYFTILIAKRVGPNGKVYAFDVQESPLETVKMKAQAEKLENVFTVRANLEVLGGTKLADESQDVVFLANILFQSSKKAEILQETKRVLKTGGKVVFIDWKKGTGGGPPDSLRTDEQEMQALFVQEGFSQIAPIDAGKFHYGILFVKNS